MGQEMNALRGMGALALGIAGIVALFTVALLLLRGVAYVSEIVIPWLVDASGFAFWICLLIFLPLSFIRKTRVAAMWGFLLSSFVFGTCVWVYGFLVTYMTWGIVAVAIGLFVFGVGVVPIAIIASMVHGEWPTVLELVLMTVLTFATRAYSLYVAKKADEDENNRSLLELTAR